MNEKKIVPVLIRLPIEVHTLLKLEAVKDRISLHDKIVERIEKSMNGSRSKVSPLQSVKSA